MDCDGSSVGTLISLCKNEKPGCDETLPGKITEVIPSGSDEVSASTAIVSGVALALACSEVSAEV